MNRADTSRRGRAHTVGGEKPKYVVERDWACAPDRPEQVTLSHRWMKNRHTRHICVAHTGAASLLAERGKNGVYISYLLLHLYIMSFFTFSLYSLTTWTKLSPIWTNQGKQTMPTDFFVCIFCALWLKTWRRLLTGAHFQVREFFCWLYRRHRVMIECVSLDQ